MESRIFKASVSRGIVKGANVLTPDVIEVDNYALTWRRRGKLLLNNHQKVIPIPHITGVSVNNTLWGSNIHIHTINESIVVENFTRKDAKELQSILRGYINSRGR